MLRSLTYSLRTLSVSSHLPIASTRMMSTFRPATPQPTASLFSTLLHRFMSSVPTVDDDATPPDAATTDSTSRTRRPASPETAREKKTVDRLRRVMRREKQRMMTEQQRATRQKRRERAQITKEKEKAMKVREKERSQKHAAILKEAQAALEKQYEKLERQARPKPPLSAYSSFVKAIYPSVVETFATTEGQTGAQRVRDLIKEAARRWSALSDEEKQTYKSAYQNARSAYDLQVAKYEQTDMFRPRKVASGFALFVQDSWRSPRQPGAEPTSPTQGIADYARRWTLLPAEEKQKYNDRFAELKKEYTDRTARYLQARETQREAAVAQLPARFRDAIRRSLTGAQPETITLVTPGDNASQPPQQSQ